MTIVRVHPKLDRSRTSAWKLAFFKTLSWSFSAITSTPLIFAPVSWSFAAMGRIHSTLRWEALPGQNSPGDHLRTGPKQKPRGRGKTKRGLRGLVRHTGAQGEL